MQPTCLRTAASSGIAAGLCSRPGGAVIASGSTRARRCLQPQRHPLRAAFFDSCRGLAGDGDSLEVPVSSQLGMEPREEQPPVGPSNSVADATPEPAAVGETAPGPSGDAGAQRQAGARVPVPRPTLLESPVLLLTGQVRTGRRRPKARSAGDVVSASSQAPCLSLRAAPWPPFAVGGAQPEHLAHAIPRAALPLGRARRWRRRRRPAAGGRRRARRRPAAGRLHLPHLGVPAQLHCALTQPPGAAAGLTTTTTRQH